MSKPDSPSEIDRLLALMARLRNPDGGCPWDLEQTFATIAPHTIEEAYEVADAIAQNDLTALRDELGDLLFQVVFHAQMAKDAGIFDFADVARGIHDKMVARHPHVFGQAEMADAETQVVHWEQLKAEERATKAAVSGQAPSALDGVTLGLPALTRAIKLQNRAARVGFDWPSLAPVLDKLKEELAEFEAELPAADSGRLADELGDILFVIANIARHLKLDPEATLRGANAKFERRFRFVEHALAEAGRSPQQASLAEMDALWDQAKLKEGTQ